MKIAAALLTFLSLGVGVVSAQQASSETIVNLDKEFSNPDKSYRSAPFMVWNTEITRERIDHTLDQYKKQGCGGVFIHPRLGLITGYLSEDWHELVKYTVEQGCKMGLEVWLYDENSYPSGFAGGHVPREMPESVNQGQGLLPQVVDVMPNDVSDCYLIIRNENGKFTNATASAPSLKGQRGTFYLYRKTFYQPAAWYAGGSYVDLLAKGVTDKFMEITMEGYEKSFDGDLSSHIKGIFTDEPEIVSPGGVRWTPDLFAEFERAYGYDLSVCLPSLHEQVGDWRRIRHNYYQMLNHLFIERWAKPWYNYCEQKGIDWTGHYWEHNWPMVGGVTDNMSMAAWQQLPGIDMLFNQFNEESPNAQFGNIRAVKEVASLANQLGRKRILSETYGGAGWNVTFKDMKRLVDWEMVLGINLVNQHVGHMSMTGARKFDYPPMFNQSATWWDNYYVLNDYIGRISAAMSHGAQYNDILVLEPTTSVWMYNQYCGESTGERANEIGASFQKVVAQLEHAQVEFDLGCENVFRTNGSVKDGKFVVGERTYHTFVVTPETENLDRETFDLLQRFVAQGGRLIALGCPQRIDGKVSADLKAFFASDKVIGAAACTPELINTYLRSDDIHFGKVSGGDLHHHRKEFADGQTLLLVNASMDEATELEVTLAGGSVVRMDALDGQTYQIPYTQEGDKVTVKTRVEPAGSQLLRISQQPVEATAPVVLTGGEELNGVDDLKAKRLRDNVLLIDFIDLVQGDKQYKDIYYNNACIQVFQNAGLPNNPWVGAMQYKQEIMEKDLSKAPGFTATYKFTVTGDRPDLNSMKILMERPELYTVKVNGTEVKSGSDWLMDVDFKVIPIGKQVKKGENRIELSVPHPTVLTELAAIYVLGNFDVAPLNDRWVITPAQEPNACDSWAKAGAPFYPWEMGYSKRFKIDDPEKGYYVKADQWVGSLVEVWVNGTKAGVIFAEPYVMDVKKLLRKGMNHVELRVVGNMENFIGPHHKAYSGIVDPGCWNVPTWRKASEYICTPFGLMSDFALMRQPQ